MRTFLNKVAVITDGSSGIGKKVAKRLVAGGASEVIGGRDADKLVQAAGEASWITGVVLPVDGGVTAGRI